MPRLDLGPGCTLLCDCRQVAFPLWAYVIVWEKAGTGIDASGVQEIMRVALRCLSLGSGSPSTCLGACGGVNAAQNVPEFYDNYKFCLCRWWQKWSYHTIWAVGALARGRGPVVRNQG